MKDVDAWILNKKVFESLNLRLYEGDNTVIIGPNGAGKSALIKLIERSIYPVVKENSFIKIFGVQNINLWDLRRQIGFVSKDLEDRIPSNIKSRSLIATGYYGTNKLHNDHKLSKGQEKRVEYLLSELSLESLANNKYSELSSGQKRAILIARSIVNNPKIIILDEPLCNLDFKCKSYLLSKLNKLHDSGITLLQVTHNLDSINSRTNRIIILNNGKIVKDGNPHECLRSEIISNVYNTPLSVKTYRNYWQVFSVVK